MQFKKSYGQYKIESCPFCSKRSLIKNSQNIPVCSDHKNRELIDLKCLCGNLLEPKYGKFGAYFNCIICGNINFKKVKEINPKNFGMELFKSQ